MAEAVITTIAGDVMSNLVAQALEKLGGLWGVQHEIEVFRDKVSALAALLEDAEEQYYQSRYVKDWVQKLKDAFYDAQDMLEELNIEAVRRDLRGHNGISKEVRTFFSRSNQLGFKLKMSNQMRAVSKRIEDIDKEKTFTLNPHSKKEWGKREETYSFIREGDITGRENDKERVMEFLLDSNEKENVSVLPIVGIGGLGKTALAQFVYNDERVSKRFDLKMWVCVSDGFDIEKIVKNILDCLKEKEPTDGAMEQSQNKLRAAIDGKRYLLVLDDVWIKDPETRTKEQDMWLKLKTLLMGGARRSKILITTRFHSVAEITRTAPPYLLRGLSDSSSLDLLLQMARRKVEEIQGLGMLDIAQDIVRKCSGVPLVVRTVGHLLFSKKTRGEWLHFKDDKLSQVSQSEENIRSILRLSYDHLPSHLKQCFAFCSLFPKDYEMDKQTLVDLWIAEGFIQSPNTSQHLEDIAHEYFMDLLWSNFFQDYKQDPFTDKETCKMHDLMHDLACLVAGTECWVAWDGTKPIHERTRHISYDSTFNLMGELPVLCLKASAVRTFLSTARHGRMISEADIHKVIQTFKRLHVTDLHGADIKKVPRFICKLKHLTYLDLSNSYALKRLPKSITRLQNLQTLSLNGCSSLEELPRGIRKLVSLRNLDIDGCSELSYMPRGLGQLSSLHRLTRFILPNNKSRAKDYCGLGELNGLNDIRGSLRMENLGHERDPRAESGTANIEGKKFLRCLELVWSDGLFEDAERAEALLDGMRPNSNLQKLRIKGYGGERFPRWMIDNHVSSCLNLVEVSFDRCSIRKHLAVLGQLPDLKKLGISRLSELEYNEPKPSSSAPSLPLFPSLLTFNISSCGKLKALPPIPSLLKLHIEECGNLKALPPTPLLEELIISKLSELEYIIEPNPLSLPPSTPSSFPSLLKLDISECGKLKALPPTPRLEELSISSLTELEYIFEPNPSAPSTPSFPSLLTLHISFCEKLKALPPTPRLEELSISSLSELEYIIEPSTSSSSFPNLLKLRISECGKLKALPPTPHLEELKLQGSINIGVLNHMLAGLCKLRTLVIRWMTLPGFLPEECLKNLTSLESLEFYICDGLISLSRGMRHLSNLMDLHIDHCWDLDICKDESGNILDFHPLPPLRSLRINHLPKLESLPPWLLQLTTLEHLRIGACVNFKELPEQIEALQSLRELRIINCHSLTSLPKGMQRLTSLTHLTIWVCKELDICKDESGNILDFHPLRSLRSLDINGLPKLESLPTWLLQLTTLEHLEIFNCVNLKKLPEQIEALQSLQQLEIRNCPSLTSLPEGMRRLASLTHLRIDGCPKLEKRCKRDAGEDWYKISHIPHPTVG